MSFLRKRTARYLHDRHNSEKLHEIRCGNVDNQWLSVSYDATNHEAKKRNVLNRTFTFFPLINEGIYVLVYWLIGYDQLHIDQLVF